MVSDVLFKLWKCYSTGNDRACCRCKNSRRVGVVQHNTCKCLPCITACQNYSHGKNCKKVQSASQATHVTIIHVAYDPTLVTVILKLWGKGKRPSIGLSPSCVDNKQMWTTTCVVLLHSSHETWVMTLCLVTCVHKRMCSRDKWCWYQGRWVNTTQVNEYRVKAACQVCTFPS